MGGAPAAVAAPSQNSSHCPNKPLERHAALPRIASLRAGRLPRSWASLTNLDNLWVQFNQLTVSMHPPHTGGTVAPRSASAACGAAGCVRVVVLLVGGLPEGLLPAPLSARPWARASPACSRILCLHAPRLSFLPSAQGELPAEYSKLTSLKEFYFGGNRFESALPPQWGDLPNIEVVLALAFCSLSPSNRAGTHDTG